MALVYPLSLAAFFDKVQVKDCKLKIDDNQETTGLGSGEILTAQKAPPAWLGSVSMRASHDEVAEVQALIEALDGSINSFYLYDTRRIFPIAYPDGAGLTIPAGGIKINSLGANNKSFSLKNAMANQIFSVGDLLSFDYGSNPVRRAMHRVVEASVASGTGVTPVFEVRPHFRVGVGVDVVVTVIKPAVKMRIVPGTFDEGSDTEVTTTLSFQARQTI
jgi:hypothetical protein